MKILNHFDNNPNLSLALGFFDGVHLGHQCVIKNTVQVAKENKVKSAVITFKNSPRDFFKWKVESGKWKVGEKNNFPLSTFHFPLSKNIITLEERLELIAKMEVDYAYVVEFDQELASLSAKQYLEEKLVKHFSPIAITTGFNHTFGSDKAGAQLLKACQEKYRYQYFEIPPITYDHKLISSSVIRDLIEKSNFQKAVHMLGYEFFVEGEVVTGKKLGKTISFPTANVNYPPNIIQFETGVYVAKVEINGKWKMENGKLTSHSSLLTPHSKIYRAVLNYGSKPTVKSGGQNILEAYILDFDEDIYGETIKIIPLKKIRSERKFDSLSDLQHQITKDVAETNQFFRKSC